MVNLDKHFGRLGNRMFQLAFCYAYARDHNIDFYYQDPKWFEKYSNEIKQIFSEGIGHDGRVSIHVRRAGNPSNLEEPDYYNNPFYKTLGEDYYKKAMDLFPNRKFIVFSDDIEWCVNQEMFKNCDFSDRSEKEDFTLMASCDGHIIANSTFSWWAAYLGKGRVVAPKEWYADGIERTICPKEWIKI